MPIADLFTQIDDSFLIAHLKNNITYKRIQTKEVENKIKSVYENGSNLKLEYNG